jgi:hypothetical protein
MDLNITWPRAMKLLSEIENMPPESIRRVVESYMVKVAMGQKKLNDKAQRALQVMGAFCNVAYGDTLAPLVVAIGELFDEEEN